MKHQFPFILLLCIYWNYFQEEHKYILPIHFFQTVSRKVEALNFGVTRFEGTGGKSKKRGEEKFFNQGLIDRSQRLLVRVPSACYAVIPRLCAKSAVKMIEPQLTA